MTSGKAGGHDIPTDIMTLPLFYRVRLFCPHRLCLRIGVQW